MRAILTAFFRQTCIFFVFWTYFSLLFLALFRAPIWWILSTLLSTVLFLFFRWIGRKVITENSRALQSEKPIPTYLNYAVRVLSDYYAKPTPRIVLHKVPLYSVALRSKNLAGFELCLSENFLQLRREEQLPILESVLRQFSPIHTQIRSLQIEWDNAFGHWFEKCPDSMRFFVFLLFYPVSRIALSFLSSGQPTVKLEGDTLLEKMVNQRAVLENDRWANKNYAYFWAELVIWPQKILKKDIDPDFIPRLMSAFRISLRTGQSAV